jgi:hypothetical protein
MLAAGLLKKEFPQRSTMVLRTTTKRRSLLSVHWLWSSLRSSRAPAPILQGIAGHQPAVRQQRGLRPGQLAARLGARNVSKVGSLIRAFELGEPLSDHWFQKLVAALQPDPIELRHCLELDQAEAAEQLRGSDHVQLRSEPALLNMWMDSELRFSWTGAAKASARGPG